MNLFIENLTKSLNLQKQKVLNVLHKSGPSKENQKKIYKRLKIVVRPVLGDIHRFRSDFFSSARYTKKIHVKVYGLIFFRCGI